MKVSMIGAGKLGFPVSLAMASKGHEVMLYDINLDLLRQYQNGNLPMVEENLKEFYDKHSRKLSYSHIMAGAIMDADIIFVAVQTPHAPEQDGSVRFKHVRKDFELAYVKDAVKMLSSYRHDAYIVVISTMLPGSMDEEISTWTGNFTGKLIYSPQFIAMGTVINDYCNPEFWLIGEKSKGDADKLCEFYDTINPDVPKRRMSWASAELAKVAYNTHITMKITLANTIMELCARQGKANCDDVMNALKLGTDRITSPAYMTPGMVDGGGCHPRDNIALSWLNDKLGMHYNIFDWMMTTREKQVEFLADLICRQNKLYVMLMGEEFKAGTKLTDGSPAILLKNILRERGVVTIDCDNTTDIRDICYVMTVNDPKYMEHDFNRSSVILDPWGMFEKAPQGCKLISVGRN